MLDLYFQPHGIWRINHVSDAQISTHFYPSLNMEVTVFKRASDGLSHVVFRWPDYWPQYDIQGWADR